MAANRLLAIAAALFVVAGCGVPTAQAPRLNVVPTPLRTFEPHDWRLTNNQIFLWKADMSPETATKALNISDLIDDLNRKAPRLAATLDKAGTEASQLEEALNRARKSLDGIKTQTHAADQAVHEAQKALKDEQGKTSPRPEVVNQLSKQIADLNEKLNALRKAQTAQQEAVTREQAALDEKNAQVAQLGTAVQAVSDQGTQAVTDIMQITEWFDLSASGVVVFQFKGNGVIDAEIDGWNMNDGGLPHSFSTTPEPGKRPTLRNVAYEALGGVFIFDVDVYADPGQKQLAETWNFRAARIQYDAVDGQHAFGGEITRTRFLPGGKAELTRGMCKFVDNNN